MAGVISTEGRNLVEVSHCDVISTEGRNLFEFSHFVVISTEGRNLLEVSHCVRDDERCAGEGGMLGGGEAAATPRHSINDGVISTEGRNLIIFNS